MASEGWSGVLLFISTVQKNSFCRRAFVPAINWAREREREKRKMRKSQESVSSVIVVDRVLALAWEFSEGPTDFGTGGKSRKNQVWHAKRSAWWWHLALYVQGQGLSAPKFNHLLGDFPRSHSTCFSIRGNADCLTVSPSSVEGKLSGGFWRKRLRWFNKVNKVSSGLVRMVLGQLWCLALGEMVFCCDIFMFCSYRVRCWIVDREDFGHVSV